MELLHDSRTARKILLLQECQSEALVLTSKKQLDAWPADLAATVEICARRGLPVRILCEGICFPSSSRVSALTQAGAKIREARGFLPWLRLPRRAQSELWVFDRTETMVASCLLGPEVAHGTAAYFDQRWATGEGSLAFSIRHTSYALHSGRMSAREFFACLLTAREEIGLCLPGRRVSKVVEAALHEALARGVRVTIFVNADREDAPALRRLRRLHLAGATLKVCGSQLPSECAVVDAGAVFMGRLPSSWRPIPPADSPAFLLRNPRISRELLENLESQVSVEISHHHEPSRFAFP